MRDDIVIIGGGLAGSEAAWQAANRGAKVTLYEMRPKEMTQAAQDRRFGGVGLLEFARLRGSTERPRHLEGGNAPSQFAHYSGGG